MKTGKNVEDVRRIENGVRMTKALRNAGGKLLKKFAEDAKFMKVISYKSFQALWQLSSQDGRYFTLLTVPVSNRISFMEAGNSLKYNFEMSMFRDYINEQYCIFMIPESADRNAEKGIMFTVPVSIGVVDEDLHFMNPGDEDKIQKLDGVKAKMKFAMVRLINMYLPMFVQTAKEDGTVKVVVKIHEPVDTWHWYNIKIDYECIEDYLLTKVDAMC